jgi:hypothetical protein
MDWGLVVHQGGGQYKGGCEVTWFEKDELSLSFEDTDYVYMCVQTTWNQFAHEIAPRGLVVPTCRDETTVVDIFITHKQWLSTFSSTMV